jgi:hypothetical protein
MGDNLSYFSFNGKSPLNQLLVSMLIIVVIGTFLFTGFLLAGAKIFDFDFGNWGDLISKNVGEDSSRIPKVFIDFTGYIFLTHSRNNYSYTDETCSRDQLFRFKVTSYQ